MAGKFGIINEKKLTEPVEKVTGSLTVKIPNNKVAIENLSGGNQQKVLIGRWLLSNSDIFILDEPTRGIDVMAKYEIYKIMRDLTRQGKTIIIPILVTLAIVALIGLVNGLMISKLKLAPFIATYGMASVIYGLNQLYFAKEPNNSQPIGGIRDDLTILSRFKVGGQISFLVVIALIVMAIVWFALNKTTFGKNIYIVGGNSDAAKVSGINVHKVTIACFIIESILVGLAGILEVARTGGANSSYGNAYEFDAISSCVVGGVSLSGGIGKVS